GGIQERMRLVKSSSAGRRRRRVLKWQLRAWWLRVWVRCKIVETRCRWRVRFSTSNGSVLTRALAASRTWLSVIAGFFPPQPLGLAGQEEMTHHGDVQVAHHRLILADFEMR